MSAAVYWALWDVAQHFRAGGPVMIPLVLTSLALGFLIAHKTLVVYRLSHGDAGRAQAEDWVVSGRVEGPGNPHGAARMMIQAFLARRTGQPERDQGILQEVEKALSTKLDDNLASIGALAGIAPLLGLLGTVLGMMAAFDVLSAFGTGNAQAMAQSISEALVTTETGLLIAIPAVYMKAFLEKRVENIKTRLSRIVIHLSVHVASSQEQPV